MKSNLSYFQHPTHLFFERKIQRLIKAYKGDGFMLYIYLKSEIFRVNGYYLKYDEFLPEDLTTWFSFLDKQFISEVIQFTVDTGLFDKEVFLKCHILTSKEIQEDFLEIMAKMKRKVDPFEPEIDLLSSPNRLLKNPNNTEIAHNNSLIILQSSEVGSNISTILPKTSENTLEINDDIRKSSEDVIQTEEQSLERKEKLETDKIYRNLSISINRERVSEIFFIEKNYPEEELQKFINHYEKSGWIDKNGNKVVDPYAAARNWAQTNTPTKHYIPISLHAPWVRIWSEYKDKLGFEGANHLLRIKPIIKDSAITFICSFEDKEICEASLESLSPILKSVLGNQIKLEYKIFI